MENGHQKLFYLEKLAKVKNGLENYRIDSFINELNSKKGKNKGAILSFVRGLRLSALLIYSIRELLEGSNKCANWGHIIDEDGKLCSRECDIIIHNKDIPKYQWNGDGGSNPIMDFRFIPQSAVNVVISCKSYITKSKIEVDYYNDMREFVDRIWLFAECCGPRSEKPIEEEAKKIGYENFYYLYKWHKKNNEVIEQNEQWYDFVDSILSLR